MDIHKTIFALFISFCWIYSFATEHEAKPVKVLSQVRSDEVTLRWMRSQDNGDWERNFSDKDLLVLNLLNQNTSLKIELMRNRHLVHPKLITRVVGNGNSSLYKQTVSNCLYQGSVLGLGTSRVTLSGCFSSYRGYIFHKGKSWFIQPRKRKNTQTVVHTISRVRSEGLNFSSSCPVEGTPHNLWRDVQNLNESQRRGRHKRSTDVKLLELFVVFSNGMYKNFLNGDKKNADDYAVEMAGHLDTFYKFDVGVRIALVGLEVWESTDMVTMVTDAKELLGNFIDYAKTSLKSFKYDLATLVADQNFDYNIAGMAHVDVICSPLSAAVIKHFTGAADPKLKSAVSLAHEIGHALGLVHDTANCACGDRTGKCIMAADTSLDPQSFSQCSKDALSKMFREGGASCMYDAPRHVFNGPICGNGVKEQGEVCDCGSIAECSKDVCCEYGCKLKPNAQCNSGGCCKNCKIVSAGRICRKKQNECDLEEFCDGTKSECPSNLHLPDMGTCGPASNGGFCYKGKCRHTQAQCEYLWGQGSTAAHFTCYSSNMKGTVKGNCGASRSGGNVNYKKCEEGNVMCGMLQCVTKRTSPMVGVSRQIINTMMGPYSCMSVAIDLGDDVPDPGLVDDGSPCTHFDPPNQEPGICLSGKCVVLQNVPKTTCPVDGSGQECASHGTCTNDGSCFCDDGFTGADCSKPGGVPRIRSSTSPTTPLSSSSHTSAVSTLSTSMSSFLPGLPSVQPSTPTPSSSTPKEQTPTDHLTEIVCGIIGGLIGFGALFFVLWRCKRPNFFWKWLESKPEKNGTSPQKKPSTAWGEHSGPGKGKPPVSTQNQIKPSHGTSKPSVTSLPTTWVRPGVGHLPGPTTTVGRPSMVPGNWFISPGHGHGHSQGQGHGHSNGHMTGQSGGNHGRGHAHGHGNRNARLSTSDYGSQESLQSIKLDYDRGPSADALPGEVTMTPSRRFSSNV